MSIPIKLHILTADRELKAYQKQIQLIAVRSIKKIQKFLPFRQPVDVVIYRYYNEEPDLAVSGYCPNGNTVLIYTNPKQKNYEQLLKVQLPTTVAHELHHACRWQGPGYGETLLDSFITEGLASHFELEAFGGKPSGYNVKFSSKELKKFWQKAKKELYSKKYSHEDWFFGNKRFNIPRHLGYALSFWLVDKILTSGKPSDLVLKKTKQILSKFPNDFSL